jgi:ParB/RepB/Spo0J family partition protein
MTDRTTQEVALDDLHESPFNSRLRYAGLQELADNIKSEGRIHSALLARPNPKGPGYELVFGHRRRRAARLAGLLTAPVDVREMSDEEVRSAQAAENLQRDNITALEEAQSYADMMALDHLSADQVCQRVGRSRSHVYGRLKLLQTTPTVRTALQAGEVGSEVALLLARLRTEKLQAKALAAIKGKALSLGDGGKASFRRIRDLLVEEFTLQFKGAIFDREDETLVPEAGTCSACPKRTGNAPEFEDVATEEYARAQYGPRGGPDACTDPDCWAGKKAAHLARAAKALQDDGKVVVTGNAARSAVSARGEIKGAYIALKDVAATLKGKKGLVSLPTVNIQDPRTGRIHKAVKRADVVSAGGQLELPVTRSSGYDAGAYAEERRKKADARTVEQARRSGLMAEARGRMRTAEQGSLVELRLIAWLLLDKLDHQVEGRVLELHGLQRGDSLASHLDALTGTQLRYVLLDCVIEEAAEVDDWDIDNGRDLVDVLCKAYGVDPEGACTPAPAGAGADQVEAEPYPRLSGVRYWCTDTGQTWTGRGLKPAWITAALAAGKTLADFEVKQVAEQSALEA